MIIHDVKQGTPEWLKLRLGVVTASEFDSLISPTWKTRTGEGPKTYIYKKVCEKVLGFSSDEGAGSWAMSQGTILEREAIPWLEFTQDITVDRVGFISDDLRTVGCSPDGLIGTDGGLEVKSPQPETHLRYMLEKELPLAYRAQVHGSMWITGRKWWKFLSYSRQFPAFLLHVERDDEIIKAIDQAVTIAAHQIRDSAIYVKELKDAENMLQEKLHSNG